MATNTTLYRKEGQTVQEIAPKTNADQVIVPDENGNSSTVSAEIVKLRQSIAVAIDAGIHFKGALTQAAPLPTVAYKAGWQYVVKEAGTYAGYACEVGDVVLCVKDYASGSASNADWVVMQANLDGAVIGPESSLAGHVVVFVGTDGKHIADSGLTIAKSVPADAVFTDTTYLPATEQYDGLLSAAMFTKLFNIEAGADKTDAENVSAAGAFMKDTHTADNIKDGASKVLMTPAERAKLADVAMGAQPNQNAFSEVKVGATTIAAGSPTDALEIEAGEGVTLSVAGKKVTVKETYVDSCVVTSLENVPANLRNGGLVILTQ